MSCEEGNCVISLIEATIPFTWTNITDSDRLTVTEAKKETQIAFTPAYYQSIPVLVKALHAAIKKKGVRDIKFTMDSTTMRVSVDCWAKSSDGRRGPC